MKKNEDIFKIAIVFIIVILTFTLQQMYLLTAYGGVAEIRIRYYGFPVMMVSLTVFILYMMQYLGIMSINIKLKCIHKVCLGIFLGVSAVLYVIVVSSQIGPFMMGINVFFIYMPLVKSLNTAGGTIVLQVYGCLLYLLLLSKENSSAKG